MTTPASPVQRYIDSLHTEFTELADGEVAGYIPELAAADPEGFGIALTTTDGHTYATGDADTEFTIQSISKPFIYGIALATHGTAGVAAKIGVEPTGDAFNSISLEPDSGRPLNPMINAGAITATSLVPGETPADRLELILRSFEHYTGHPVAVDRSVYESERDSGHRNRAIGHMLRSFGVLTGDPEEALDLYFRQCSIAVSCRDLSLMAATLANGGINPHTGHRALSRGLVDDVLSVMTTCGMYDGAGDWVVSVGLPAKSGVAGGILAVLPGQLGIGVFSPPLDRHGNSVRGVAVCRRISHDQQLHFLNVARSSRSVIASSLDISEVRSRRQRPAEQMAALAAAEDRGRLYTLQGDLLFAGGERVTRAIWDRMPGLVVAIADLTDVTAVSRPAARLLAELGESMSADGGQLILVGADGHPDLAAELGDDAGVIASFGDIDPALEWAEHLVLSAIEAPEGTEQQVPLAAHQLARGLSAEQLAELEGAVESRSFRRGDVIFAAGDPARELYALIAGEVTAFAQDRSGRRQRISTIPPGMTFGEAAMIDERPRTITVIADGQGELRVLSHRAYAALDAELKAHILENLLASTYEVVAHLSRAAGWTPAAAAG